MAPPGPFAVSRRAMCVNGSRSSQSVRFPSAPTQDSEARVPAMQGQLSSRAELVNVLEQVRRVIEHTIGTGTLEFLESVAARKQADSQCARTLRREHVPNAVADDESRSYVNSQTFGSRDEQIGVRLRKSHLIARDDRNVADIDADFFQGQTCGLQP